MGHSQVLSSVAERTKNCDMVMWHDKCRNMVPKHSYNGQGQGWGSLLLAFIIVVVIVWLVLWVTKPEFVQKDDYDHKKTGEVDGGRALCAAIFIALIICLILWALK